MAIIRAIVTYHRHANCKTPRGLFARLIDRGIINDNVVMIPGRREREGKAPAGRTSDRSIARSVAGGSRENSRTRISSWVLPDLGEGRPSLALFYLRISIKCRSIDDNHERRTKAALGLEGENVSETRSEAKRGRSEAVGPAGGGENNGGQRVA